MKYEAEVNATDRHVRQDIFVYQMKAYTMSSLGRFILGTNHSLKLWGPKKFQNHFLNLWPI